VPRPKLHSRRPNRNIQVRAPMPHRGGSGGRDEDDDVVDDGDDR
jgi:hypothetical protein